MDGSLGSVSGRNTASAAPSERRAPAGYRAPVTTPHAPVTTPEPHPSRPAVDRTSLPDLAALPGVPAAIEAARAAVTALRGHPALRRHRERIAGAAAVRAARASAALDGAPLALDGDDGDTVAGAVRDPRLAGALRATASLVDLVPVWQRAPLQALARLHVLAAADLVGPDVMGSDLVGSDLAESGLVRSGLVRSGLAEADQVGSDLLGRPRPDPVIGPRLASLAEVITAAPWPAPVVMAVVQGELLALRPFGSADGVVARAAGRLAMMSSGLDPDGLGVPEVAYLRSGHGYRVAAQGFAAGETGAVTAWLLLVCDALVAGAREGGSIADAAG